MTRHNTTETFDQQKRSGARTKMLAILGLVALALAMLAGVTAASLTASTEVAAAPNLIAEPVETPQVEETPAQLPPAPLVIDAGEEDEDLDIAPLPRDCPPGMALYQGECVEFEPPSDGCPQGMIEYEGECIEFEIPDCPPGFELIGLECVPQFDITPDADLDPTPTPVVPVDPPVEAPELPEVPEGPQSQDDCPEGTIYEAGQCLEYEVPECEDGFVLILNECVPFETEDAPAEDPENGPGIDPIPAVPVVPFDPPVLEAPKLPGDIPGPEECPPGTVFQNGVCVVVLDCAPGFMLVGLDCVPQGKDFAPTDNGCPPGSIYVDGGCILTEVPACELGFVVVDGECVKLTLEAVVIGG